MFRPISTDYLADHPLENIILTCAILRNCSISGRWGYCSTSGWWGYCSTSGRWSYCGISGWWSYCCISGKWS